MKEKINSFLINLCSEIEYGLRRMCGKPSPMKRFIVVLVISIALSILYIYIIVSSIYNMGKHDAEIRFMELQHIERLKLQQKQDSIIQLRIEN